MNRQLFIDGVAGIYAGKRFAEKFTAEGWNFKDMDKADEERIIDALITGLIESENAEEYWDTCEELNSLTMQNEDGIEYSIEWYDGDIFIQEITPYEPIDVSHIEHAIKDFDLAELMIAVSRRVIEAQRKYHNEKMMGQYSAHHLDLTHKYAELLNKVCEGKHPMNGEIAIIFGYCSKAIDHSIHNDE